MKIIWVISLVAMMLGSLEAGWVRSLGNMQNSQTLKQSYMQGLLLHQSYGTYELPPLLEEKRVQKFYQERDFHTFWFNDFNEPDLSVMELISSIKRSSSEGLDPQDYHYDVIESLFQTIQNDQLFSLKEQNLAVIMLDLLLSDAFLALAHDLYEGLIDRQKFQATLKRLSEERDIKYTWEIALKSLNTLSLLKEAKRSGEVEQTLYGLVTNNLIYTRLLEAYERYKLIVASGGFTKVPAINLHIGSQGKAVLALAKRLYESGDLSYFDESMQRFDKELQSALKHFQLRMGMWPSGILNQRTRQALNISAKVRLRLVKLNLERARWERESMRNRYFLINIPAFMVYFMDGEQKLLQMRVVVGQLKNPTPIFQAYMSYVVLNPTWSVPNSIVLKEMLPRLKEDPDYLSERKFKAYNGWGKNRKEIDPFDIDWYMYDEDSTLPFNFVRESGKGNPLGRMKFMFPNRYAVYMHDTPSKNLFKKSVRAYSHGCIRLQNPQKLLKVVAQNYMDRPYESLQRILNSKENTSLQLKEKIPVYIRYYTVWVDERGVNFRGDIYGYDKIQLKLMRRK